MDNLMSDEELMAQLVDLLIDYDKYTKYNEPIVWNVRKEEFIDLINDQKRAYAERMTEMLDKLGVEKCPVCNDHLIDEDMNVCENCDYGVHEWCTGYTYDGDGEYPSESAFAVCKTCYRQPQGKRIEGKE